MIKLILKYTLRSVIAWKLLILFPIIPFLMYKEVGSLVGIVMVNILYQDFKDPTFFTLPHILLYKITQADIKQILIRQHLAIIVLMLLWYVIGAAFGYWFLTISPSLSVEFKFVDIWILVSHLFIALGAISILHIHFGRKWFHQVFVLLITNTFLLAIWGIFQFTFLIQPYLISILVMACIAFWYMGVRFFISNQDFFIE